MEILCPIKGPLAEMHARIADIDAGRVTCLPWEEVRERLWSRV